MSGNVEEHTPRFFVAFLCGALAECSREPLSRSWVVRLRAKLDPDDGGELITTFPGVGYRMELPGA